MPRYHKALLILPLATALTVAAGCGNDAPTAGRDAAAQRGRQVAQDWGCVTCHSDDGEPSTGPTWQGIWGTTVQLDDGRTAVVDRDYVVRSIRASDVDVVDGFGPVMPTFNLTDAEIDDVVAYLRSLGDTN